jgi:tetratricopeptide (TPR) repeat protein
MLLGLAPPAVRSQGPDESERQRALALLWQKSRSEEALPLLEKLATEYPGDGDVLFSLGFCLLAHAKLLKEPAERKATRIRARGFFLRAKGLGLKAPLLTSILEALPADGGKDDLYSLNADADAAMREGEQAFVKGNFAEAATAYQRAFKADPKLYEAPLFTGDMYFKMDDNEKAAEWYARAIEVNPDRETAYRYSATPFLRQGKLEEARSRYIEAVVAEPYNRMSWSGLSQWADAAGVSLSHPKVEIPTSVTPLKDNKMSISLDPKTLDDSQISKGLGAWISYGLTRAAWATSKFAQAFPNEKTYRHTLQEEVAALKGVVALVRQQQKENKIKELDLSLANLVMLVDDDLLEPFVLLALADNDIAADYPAYRKANREKLRRYLFQHVTAKQGGIRQTVSALP